MTSVHHESSTPYVRATAVVFSQDDRVLLVKHNYEDDWALPGGLVVPGEESEQRAVSEVAKETGVDIVMDPVHVGRHTDDVVSHEIYVAAVYGEPIPDHRGVQDAIWWDAAQPLQVQPHVTAIMDIADSVVDSIEYDTEDEAEFEASSEHPQRSFIEEEERRSRWVQAIDVFFLCLFAVLDTIIDLILWWKQNERAVKPTERTKFSPELRRSLGVAQDRRCMYCGVRKSLKNLQIDHKDPVARGGSNDPSNLQLLCQPCNGRKKIHTDEEFRSRYAALVSRPAKSGRSRPPTEVIPQSAFRAIMKRTSAPAAVQAHNANKYMTPKQRIHSGAPIVAGVMGGLWCVALVLLFPSNDFVANVAVWGGLIIAGLMWPGLIVRARYTGRLDEE